MPVQHHLVWGSVQSRLDDLDPEVMLPTFNADFGQRDLQRGECLWDFGLIVRIDLADEGSVKPEVVSQALKKYKIDSEKPNPVTD